MAFYLPLLTVSSIQGPNLLVCNAELVVGECIKALHQDLLKDVGVSNGDPGRGHVVETPETTKPGHKMFGDIFQNYLLNIFMSSSCPITCKLL